MKIDVVTPYFYPVIGGAEKYILELMRRIAKKGHSVRVHTSNVDIERNTLEPEGEIDGIEIRRYKPDIARGYYMTRFKPEIREGSIVHLAGYGFYTNNYVYKKFRKTNRFVMSTLHGPMMTHVKWKTKMMRSVYDMSYGVKLLRGVGKVLILTEDEREWLTGRGVDDSNIVVLPGGVDDSAFVSPAKAAGDFSKYSPYILFIGRVHKEKCVDDMLRALHRIKRDDVGIVVVGPDGGEVENLKKLADELNMSKRVHFTGSVDENEKKQSIIGSSFLVLPSLHEGQGMVVVEGWALGKTTIGTRVGGLKHMISDGNDGLLYTQGHVAALAQKMKKLLDNEELSMKLGKAGRENAQKSYRWNDLALKLEKVYVDVGTK